MNLTDKLMELVENSESFKKIMADGIVEDKEVEEQAARVSELLDELERQLPPAHFELVTKAIAELSVLHVVYSYNQSYNQI